MNMSGEKGKRVSVIYFISFISAESEFLSIHSSFITLKTNFSKVNKKYQNFSTRKNVIAFM